MKRKGKCTENNMKFFSLSYLYQKTISFGALPNATTKTVNHGISGLKNVIDIRTTISNGTSSDSIRTIVPYVQGDTTREISIYVTGNYIGIVTYDDKSVFTSCYVTIKYTK